MSRLVNDDSNCSSGNNSQIIENLSDNSTKDNISDDIIRNSNFPKKRKSINCCNSFDSIPNSKMMINNKSNIPFIDVRKKISKSHSNYNRSPDIISISKNYNEIRSVSSKIILNEPSTQKINY